MNGQWEPAEKVQKNSAGEFRAFIGGEWVPVAKAQKNASGQYRVMRGANDANAEPILSREQRPNQGQVASPVEVVAGSAPTRFALGAAAPFFAAGQALDEGRKALGLPEWLRPESAIAYERIKPMVAAGRREIGSTGLDWAEMGGAAMGPASLATMKIAPAASYGGKVLQGVGVGTGFGAATPATQDDDFWNQKAAQAGSGAVLGGFLSAIAPLVAKGGVAAYRALIEPWANPAAIKGRAFLEAAGDKADELIALLRQNQQIVPGSKASAGEVAAPAGSAEFSALQRSASNVKPSEYQAVVDAQNAARIAQLRTVGGTPQELQARITARGENANANYGAVRNDLISPQSEVEVMESAIASRAASKGEALRDWGRFATTEAQNQVRADNFVPVPGMPRVAGRASNFPERAQEGALAAKDAATIAALRQKEKEFLDSTMETLRQTVGLEDKSLNFFLKRPSMRAAVEDAIKGAQESGSYFPQKAGDKFSVENLQRIKMALDDIIKDPKTFGLKGTEQAEVNATRNAFVKWLSNKSPRWKEARLQYQAESRPIDQMKIGQYLESKLVPALSEEAPQKAATFATALENAPSTIKKATGSNLTPTLEERLTPDQLAAVNSVRDDLARGARFEQLATKGSKAAPDAVKLATRSMEQQTGGPVRIGILERAAMIANSIIQRAEGKINQRLASEIAMEMLNPPGVADTMAKAQARAQQNKMWANAIQQMKLPAIAVGAQVAEER